ncbi:hypothetical protein B0J12DRAFT_43999 [Macrophomina phaseolina]|uniref:Fungal N-terminal domain-containing protein n=1 Tax=Macrophomina phaseolina TaxID=35725 RepID=A0ABQ8GDQ0_9PEZI|nr:hypothetical protein B0J12DRAFT_43999 [Macrophomina phaseolina]
MSDPFSVAGSAVGIVSLGLAVCQSVVRYYDAYKGQGDEINDMLERTSRLVSVLKLLKLRLDNYTIAYPQPVDQILACLASFENAVTRLGALIRKCEHAAASDTFHQKLCTVGRKSLYPFRQKTLRAWAESVSESQKDIDVVIGILQLEMQDTTNSTISAVAIRNEAIFQNQDLLLRRLEAIHHSIKTSQVPTATSIDAAPPANSISLTEQARVQAATNVSLPVRAAHSRTDLTFCRCRPWARVRESRLQFRSIVLLWRNKEISQHRDNCPYRTLSIICHQYGAEIPLSTSVRKWTAHATLNFNQTIGIFSVTLTLTFRAIVPDHSPAFNMLSLAWDSRSTEEFESAFQSLVRTFQDGVAGPTDMNESGQTLLHKAAEELRSVPYSVTGRELIEVCARYQKLVIGLVSLGVPADPIDDNGIYITNAYYSLTLVERFHECLPPEDTHDLFHFGEQLVERLDFDFSTLSQLLSEMVRSQYPDASGEKIRLVSFIVEFQRRSPNFMEAMECGKLSQAVLRRSVKGVSDLVKRSPRALYERNVIQQTPLHLAVGWPTGMEILLSCYAGRDLVNVGDVLGLLPLEYACWYPCLRSVQLLLGADSRITKRISTYAYKNAKNTILREVAFGVAKRRNQLRSWARGILPPETYQSLVPPLDRALDNKQTQALEWEMHKHIGTLPQFLRTTCAFPDEEEDFGDGKQISLPAATILHDVGFRFDACNLSQMFTTFSAEYIEPAYFSATLEWAIQTQFFVQPLYRMATLVESHVVNSGNSSAADGDHLKALGILWHGFCEEYLVGQDCTCYSCGDLSQIFVNDEGSGREPTPRSQALHWNQGFRKSLVPRAISAFAFDGLGLTHSASCYWTHWGNRDVIQDMQEQERDLDSAFSSLVGRLGVEYERLGTSLSDFFAEDGYAWTAVRELLNGDSAATVVADRVD